MRTKIIYDHPEPITDDVGPECMHCAFQTYVGMSGYYFCAVPYCTKTIYDLNTSKREDTNHAES